jgi:hypothetical protein
LYMGMQREIFLLNTVSVVLMVIFLSVDILFLCQSFS